MSDRKTVILNSSNTKKLSVVFELVTGKPYLLKTLPASQNQLVNLLLEGLLSGLIESWYDKKSETKYGTFLAKMFAKKGGTVARELRQIIKRQDELLYLLMSTNQAILRKDKDDFKRIKSMYKYGTKENEIYAALNNLVDSDNHNYFKTD